MNKVCIKCKKEFESTEQYFPRRNKFKLRNECRECTRIKMRTWVAANKKHTVDYHHEYIKLHYIDNIERYRSYYKNNKQQISSYNKEWKRKKRLSDPAYRLRDIVSMIVRRKLKEQNGYKNTSTWKKLPYSPQELKEHLEKQFTKEMSWNNYGEYWHVDHIIPQVLLPYKSMDDPNFNKAWALANLRPLEKKENMSKGSFYEGKRWYNKKQNQ